MHKKVIAYIAGLSAPKGRTMGHAGAIVTGAGESAAEKIQIMRDCGVIVVERPSDFGAVISKIL
jgi:malate-CoA ligase subunit alpha